MQRDLRIKRRRGCEPKGKITTYPSKEVEDMYYELQDMGFDSPRLVREQVERVVREEFEKVKALAQNQTA
jgi:hypothetical protein